MDLPDLYVFKSDEMIERAWLRVRDKMEDIDTGSARLDAATDSLTEHVFKAGWLACLTAILESENRKDGLT